MTHSKPPRWKKPYHTNSCFCW